MTIENKSGLSSNETIFHYLQNGKLKLEFDWNWLNDDLSGGKSAYIEI